MSRKNTAKPSKVQDKPKKVMDKSKVKPGGDRPKLGNISDFLKSRLGINIYSDPWQQNYVEAMLEPTKSTQAVFLDAEAGTGKTSLAISVAYYLLQKDLIDQIIYIRSSVSVREIGFLPGDIQEKEAPYMQPGLDALSRLEPKNPKLIETLINNEQLVVATTTFLRGVDWCDRKFLIIDEAQNLNLQEMQTVLTRPHDTTKIIVIGSSLQVDDPKAIRYGKPGEKLLPFNLYAKHFEENTPLNVKVLSLKNNYRGKFSQYADKIMLTIKHLEDTSQDKEKLVINIDPTEDELNHAWTSMEGKVYERNNMI